MPGDHSGVLLLLWGFTRCFHSLYLMVVSERGRSQPQAGQVGPLGALLGVKLAGEMSRK